jgi:hypothetical protein
MVNRSCTTCVYAWWDAGLWVANLSLAFASRPVCANHPDSPGRMRMAPFGEACRNYRPRPARPKGDVRQIPLGDGMYAYVDAADYEELSRYKWCLRGGYAGRYENGKIIFMHRQIMSPPRGMIVDHIDHNRLNNCRANLRVCTRRQNTCNRRKRTGSSSRFKGVSRGKGHRKWRVELLSRGRKIWVGSFTDEVEAARAYDRKAVEVFGEYAHLNFPEEWPAWRRARVRAKRPKRRK